MYSHGLLALWHEHAVAVVADVDEYLLTRTPGMGVWEVREGCASARSPAGAGLARGSS